MPPNRPQFPRQFCRQVFRCGINRLSSVSINFVPMRHVCSFFEGDLLTGLAGRFLEIAWPGRSCRFVVFGVVAVFLF